MYKQVKVKNTIFKFKKIRNKVSEKIKLLSNKLICDVTQIETHNS